MKQYSYSSPLQILESFGTYEIKIIFKQNIFKYLSIAETLSLLIDLKNVIVNY